MTSKTYDNIESLLPNSYYDPHFELDAVKLVPGQYYVSKKDIVMVTVVGSCVTACLRDKHSGIGGMNHFMLADNGRDYENAESLAARSGTYVMELLIDHLVQAGAKLRNLEAKIFGGASIMGRSTLLDTAKYNASYLRHYLNKRKITIVGESLCDFYPRKVYFFPKRNHVLVKKITRANNKTILEREQEYRLRLHKMAQHM